jgi:signal transduction histidine kinase
MRRGAGVPYPRAMDPAALFESRWTPLVVTAIITVLATETVLTGPMSPWCVAGAAVTVGVALVGCFVHLARLNPVKVGVIIVAATLASRVGNSVMLFTVVIVLASVAVEESYRVALAELGLAIGSLLVAIVAAGRAGDPTAYIAWPLGYGLGWAGALFVKSQMQLAASLQRQHEVVASEAALHERRRLAREIHDVIAHSMTVTMLHVSGARLALQDQPADVTAALDALVEAERQGRRSLADIRRTVGLLAEAGPEESQLAAPLPGASDVPQLVQSYVDAGADVRWHADGELTRLSPATGLAVYRVVQEGLANAAKHAPGAPVQVDVRMCHGLPGLAALAAKVGRPGGRIEVLVTNGAPTGPPAAVPPGGRGLAGMTERIELLGGRVRTGPHRDGWRVCARLPVAAEDAEPAGAGLDVATSW